VKAVVVYESLWGNTARIARAIAEGIGPEARALSTAETTAATIAEALEQAGYASVAKPVGFGVAGRFGPLRDGEVERAWEWGAELAATMK